MPETPDQAVDQEVGRLIGRRFDAGEPVVIVCSDEVGDYLRRLNEEATR